MTRAVALSPLGLLCNKPPWGEMVAVDLKAGKIVWRSRVGTTEDRAPLGIAFPLGTPLVNGVAITAGGLVFTGAMDAYLRAFDARSGAELWQGRLPVPGVANPMTYQWKGEQYVAIGAGGHSESGTTIGDSVVAFRLARPGETPSLWSRTIDRPGGRFMGGATWCGRGADDGGAGLALAAELKTTKTTPCTVAEALQPLQHCECARNHRHRLVVGGGRKRDAAEAHGAAETDHAGIGQHVGGRDRAHEMRGLVDRRHRAIAAIGGEVGDHHRGIGKRHQRLARDRAAIAAQPLRERQAQDRARLPVGRLGGRGKVEVLDRKIEIHHPGRKDLAKHAPGFRDAEFRCWWLLLHERPFPRLMVFAGILVAIAAKGTAAAAANGARNLA